MSKVLLQPSQSLAKNLRRVGRKLLGAAREALTDERNADGIHDARKQIKKLRGLLRLLRPAISGKSYRCANQQLRDAAHPLSTVRDAKVQAALSDELFSSLRPANAALGDLHQAIATAARSTRADAIAPGGAVTDALRQLAIVQRNVKKWTAVPDRWSSVGKGLRKTYRRARDGHHQAMALPTEHNLHQWRKHVKYLRYQLELLQVTSPQAIGPLAAGARELGELLGDHHDLDILQDYLRMNVPAHGDATELNRLLEEIDRRCEGLRQRALQVADGFFATEPAAFCRPLKTAWKVWRSGAPERLTADAKA